MVAKINVGTSLYGALAYNGLKVNEGEGKLLAVNKVFDDGSGRVDIARAVEDFRRYMPENVRTRNKVIHISLNPHPDDRLTDMEMEQLAREYLEKLGYGDQPFLIFKHEDINRQASVSPPNWNASTACTPPTAGNTAMTTPCGKWTFRRAT